MNPRWLTLRQRERVRLAIIEVAEHEQYDLQYSREVARLARDVTRRLAEERPDMERPTYPRREDTDGRLIGRSVPDQRRNVPIVPQPDCWSDGDRHSHEESVR